MPTLRYILAALVLCWSALATAAVDITFHSFNGSVLAGRYPHTFVSLEGTLDDGTQVNENFGFTAKRANLSVLRGPVEHEIAVEDAKYLKTTNRHFTLTMTDAQYRDVRALMVAWRDAPGKYYDLDTRNCIHFVGEIAKIMGLRVEYPKKLLRKPRGWLNHISALNPQLDAPAIR